MIINLNNVKTTKARVKALWLMQFNVTWEEYWDFLPKEWQHFFKVMFEDYLDNYTKSEHVEQPLLDGQTDYAQFIRDETIYNTIEKLLGGLDHTIFPNMEVGQAKEKLWDLIYRYFGLDAENDTIDFVTIRTKFKTTQEIRNELIKPFNDLVKYIVTQS